MGYGEDDGVETVGRERVGDMDAVFTLNQVGVGPWVVDGDVRSVFAESVVDVNDLSVADVGTVFLESDAEDENLRVLDQDTLLVHAFDGLISYVTTHSIVQTAGVVHNPWKNAIDLSLLNEIVRVHRDAVTADQAWGHLDEIPF